MGVVNAFVGREGSQLSGEGQNHSKGILNVGF